MGRKPRLGCYNYILTHISNSFLTIGSLCQYVPVVIESPCLVLVINDTKLLMPCV